MKCDSNYEMKEVWPSRYCDNSKCIQVNLFSRSYEFWFLEWILMGDICSLKPQHLVDITKQLWKLQKRFFFKMLSIFCWYTLSPTLLCPGREWEEEESRREEEGIGHERRKWSISAEITSAQLWWQSGRAPHGWWHLSASFRLKHHQLYKWTNLITDLFHNNNTIQKQCRKKYWNIFISTLSQ